MKRIIIIVIMLIMSVMSALFLPGFLLKQTIESYATDLFQTDVDIDSLDLSLFDGTLAVKQLSIANPDGFGADNALSVDAINVSLTIGSIFSNHVTIQEIQIIEPIVTAVNKNGRSNLFELRENYGITYSPETQGQDAVNVRRSEQKRITVDHIEIKGATLKTINQLGFNKQERTHSFPDITMTNLGKTDELIFADIVTDVIFEMSQHAPRELEGYIRGRENKIRQHIQRNLPSGLPQLQQLF